MLFVSSLDDCASITPNDSNQFLSNLTAATAAAAICTSISDAYYLPSSTSIITTNSNQAQQIPFLGKVIDTENAAIATNTSFLYHSQLPYSTGDVHNITTNFGINLASSFAVNYSNNINKTNVINENNVNGVYLSSLHYDSDNLSGIAASIASATSQNNELKAQIFESNKDIEKTHLQALAMPPTSVCGLCNEKIKEKIFTLIEGKSWHLLCTRCTVCAQPLDTVPKCFFRNGLLYCKRDYMKRFCKQCERCNHIITPGEVIMSVTREKTFHLACFNCAVCSSALHIGDTYLLGDNGTLFCNKHYDMLLPNKINVDKTNSILTLQRLIDTNKKKLNIKSNVDSDNKKSNYEDVPGLQIDTKKDIKHQIPLSSKCLLTFGDDFSQQKKSNEKQTTKHVNSNLLMPAEEDLTLLEHSNPSTSFLKMDSSCSIGTVASTASRFSTKCSMDDGLGMGSIGNSKGKRMRTSFKHQQLRTMKTYFNLNHNPDAKDLKQLSLKTGLSKRVLQVWFQNARAKFRRAQQMLPRCSAAGGDELPSANGVTYAMELHMLSNSIDLNGLSCETSLSGRTSLSPAESTSMFDGCSFADESNSSACGEDNSDNDSTTNKINTLTLIGNPMSSASGASEEKLASIVA